MKTFPYFFTWTKQKNAAFFSPVKAKGPSMYTDSRKIWDLSSVSFHASFGHSPEIIVKAIENQLKEMPIASAKASYPLKDQTTERLINYIAEDGGKIFYTVSGAESVENALKMVRYIKKKKIILARQVSYHGATLGALSVTGDWRNEQHLTTSQWTVRIPEPGDDPTLAKTRAIILKTGPENIAAIILETITGANGVIIPPQSWYDGIQKICEEFDIFLILDEVICAFGRTGHSFGFKHYNLKPDIITMAKSISAGIVPFGAVWTSEKISKFYDDEILCAGLTNYATPLGLAALSGVLELVESTSFKKNLNILIQYFHQRLENLRKIDIVKDIRKIGMLANIDLTTTISWDTFIKENIYLISYEKRIVLAPCLNFDLEQFEKAMDQLEHVLKNYNKR